MITAKSKNEVVRFINNEFELDVNISPAEDTVWLSLDQIAMLFDKNKSTISRHIKNIFEEEELAQEAVVAKFATTASDGKKYNVDYYNLDVIISVGYRVKSKQGILFRKWANNILKKYLLKGYVINANQYQIPNLEEITGLLDQYRKMDGKLPLSSDNMLDFLIAYNRGLKILDDYDHQTMRVSKGNKDTYIISYEECIEVIHKSVFQEKGDLFAIEKDNSFKSSVATIYQSFGGVDMYPTLEDKASSLLYFITKNHSFVDGNKRIAATIFLYFLDKNNALYKNNKERISNETLATLTILVASSNPNDKDNILNLIKLIIA